MTQTSSQIITDDGIQVLWTVLKTDFEERLQKVRVDKDAKIDKCGDVINMLSRKLTVWKQKLMLEETKNQRLQEVNINFMQKMHDDNQKFMNMINNSEIENKIKLIQVQTESESEKIKLLQQIKLLSKEVQKLECSRNMLNCKLNQWEKNDQELIEEINNMQNKHNVKIQKLKHSKQSAIEKLNNEHKIELNKLYRKYKTLRKKYNKLEIKENVNTEQFHQLQDEYNTLRRKHNALEIKENVNREELHQLQEKHNKLKLKYEGIAEQNECVICMDGSRQIACVPCGHRCLCPQCASGINGECPICRANVKCTMRIFE